MIGLELFGVADRVIAQVSSAQARKLILEGMVLIEMKYNLDILSAFNLAKINKDRESAKEIVVLLSTTALERLLTNAPSAGEQSGLALLTAPALRAAKKILQSDSDETFRTEESVLHSAYKRIAVLKALVSVRADNSTMKNINFTLRLKNLRDVFFEIVQQTKS